jgi:DNA-binding transcriptional MerR regulator
MPQFYRVHQFAGLAGVTVRALHHYDRLGLLRPLKRSEAGYRIYSDRDLARLEQIVVLKYLGLPLKQIGTLLVHGTRLSEAFQRQRRVLLQKRKQLDKAIEAITRAERSLRGGGETDWQLIRQIIKEIEMQQDTEWTKKYYSPEAQPKVEERKKLWSPELQAKVSAQWNDLFADIEAAIAAGEAPTGAQAQALAARWSELVRGFTGGDPEIQKGLKKMWSDQENWPKSYQSYRIKPEIQEFIMKAMKA